VLKKVLLIVFGVIIGAVGVGMVVSGVVITAQFGPDGVYESNTGTLAGTGRALVSTKAEVEDESPYGFGARSITVRAQDREGNGAVFIGIGKAADVDSYLTGVAIDEVSDIEPSPFDATVSPQVGAANPPAPQTQRFWLVQAQGTGEQHVDWDLEKGAFKAVIMNADASPNVDVRTGFDVEIPWIFPVAITFIVAGVLVFLAGFGMVVGGIRSPVISKPKLPENPLPKPLGGPMGPTP